jgi:predicted ATPase
MITNITLHNFRAFQTEVSVRIRPITVLIGKNSAGKSSLIKFLLMLRQTLESQSDSFFVLDGKHVQLGTWRDARHSMTKKAPFGDPYMRYSIQVQTTDLPQPEVRQLWKAASGSRVFSRTGGKVSLSLQLEHQPVTKESPVASYGIRGRVFYGMKFKYGMHEVIGSIGEERIFRKAATNLERTGFLRFGYRTDSVNNLIESTAAERFLEPLRYEFISQRHLSPVREASQQAIQTGSPPASDVGDRGEYAIPHLVRLFTKPNHRKEGSFVAKFAMLVGGIEAIKSVNQVANLLTHLQARNVETKAINSLADFGFGLSQCLPLFVQGAMHTEGQLLIVEQPEAQLHPTAQLELGSFFAELWSERGVPSIIETHSGNILLRLRKLVKEHRLEADDISVAYFSVDEIPRTRGASYPAVVVKNLDIKNDGSLSKGLPMEFFGADILEAMELGAANASDRN